MTVDPPSNPWRPTRAEGLRRLAEFLPRAGRDYARDRNTDRGPEDRRNVSTLSPYLRHRLVTEEEVIRDVLAVHSPSAAEKLIQEVCWRTYWKGWLELRPAVWASYRAEIRALRSAIDADSSLRDRWEAAVSGRSGIVCLDAWTRELVETGYLHNHARMWYASIWIFTLRLPWALGADFFLRHLLDGDPASNTLSWRWVGGLQTVGKVYVARPENIEKYTEGRFRPSERLASEAEARPLDGPPPPAPRPLPDRGRPDDDRPTGLLLTEEDLAPESIAAIPRTLRAVAGLGCTDDRSPWGAGALARAFAAGALDDGLRRAAEALGVSAERLDEREGSAALLEWCARHGLTQVVTPEAPEGPVRARLDAAEPRLADAGIRLVRTRRSWDETFWPLATHGFFPFRNRIPEVLRRLAIA